MTIPFTSMTLGVIEFLIESLVGIITSLYNIILSTIMDLLAKFFYGIGVELLWMADFVQSLFRRLVGLEPYWQNGVETTGDPLLGLITSDQVLEVFLALFIVAVVMLLIATIIQIIRVQYTQEGAKNTVGNIIGQTLKSFALFIIVPLGSVAGIFLANVLLGMVDAATNTSGSTTISGAIFVASAGEANRARMANNETADDGWFSSLWDGGLYITMDDEGNIEQIEATNPLGLGYIPDPYDVDSEYDADEYNELVAMANNADGRGPIFVSTTGTTTEKINDVAERIDTAFAMRAINQNTEGSEYDAEHLGATFDYGNYDMVRVYYDINEINFLVLYVAAGITIWSLYMALFGLIMRLYKAVILFVISPPVVALMPLDGGNAMGQWKTSFISTITGAYGVVVSLNLFFMILPMLKQIQLFDPNATVLGLSTSYYYNNFTYLIMVVVGCFSFKDLSKLISGILVKGGDDILGAGEGMSKKVVGTAANIAMATATGGASLAMSAKNVAASKMNKNRSNKTMKSAQEKFAAGDIQGAKEDYEKSQLYSGRSKSQLDRSKAQFGSATGFVSKGMDSVTNAMGLGKNVPGRLVKTAKAPSTAIKDVKNFNKKLANAGKDNPTFAEKIEEASNKEKAMKATLNDADSSDKAKLTGDFEGSKTNMNNLAASVNNTNDISKLETLISKMQEESNNNGTSDLSIDYLRNMTDGINSMKAALETIGKKDATAEEKDTARNILNSSRNNVGVQASGLADAHGERMDGAVKLVNNSNINATAEVKQTVFNKMSDTDGMKAEMNKIMRKMEETVKSTKSTDELKTEMSNLSKQVEGVQRTAAAAQKEAASANAAAKKAAKKK